MATTVVTNSGYESSVTPPMLEDGNNADLLLSCKEFFIKRVRCLENFRQNLNVDASASAASSSSSTRHPPPFIKDEDESPSNNGRLRLSDSLIRLKTDMMELMESDVTLIGQLITLSEAVNDFKRQTLPYLSNNVPPSSGSSSMTSLNLDDDDDATEDDVDADEEVNSQSLSNRSPLRPINRQIMLQPTSSLIDDHFETEDEDDVLESFAIPRRRYFARQSSILRIPIGPGNRRRAKSYVECVVEENHGDIQIREQKENKICSVDHKKQQQQNYQRIKPRPIVKRQSLPTFGAMWCRSLPHSPTSDSGVSVESSSTTSCDRRPSTDQMSTGALTMTSTCGDDERCYGIKPSASHDSQCSFDSGIHLVSPTVDEKEIVNV